MSSFEGGHRRHNSSNETFCRDVKTKALLNLLGAEGVEERASHAFGESNSRKRVAAAAAVGHVLSTSSSFLLLPAACWPASQPAGGPPTMTTPLVPLHSSFLAPAPPFLLKPLRARGILQKIRSAEGYAHARGRDEQNCQKTGAELRIRGDICNEPPIKQVEW